MKEKGAFLLGEKLNGKRVRKEDEFGEGRELKLI